MSSAKSKLNGKWLAWAREMSDLKTDEIAKKMGVSSDDILQWEKNGKMEINELKKLAKYYHRPPMMFYNENDPSHEYENVTDFRTIGSKEKKELSPSILNELQNAENKRENLILLEEESEDYIIPNFSISVENEINNVETISEVIKETIGMTKVHNDILVNSEKALDHWISKIEELGVLVFQFYNIDPNEMRGYAICDEKLPIIGINKKEYPNGKKFTLFHELAHLVIKNEKISISNLNKFKINDKKEFFCNKIAAEILVPAKIFEIKLESYDNNGEWEDYQIKSLSNYFKVSNEVILRRLLSFDKISKSFYNSKKKEWEKNYFALKTNNSNNKSKKSKKNNKKDKTSNKDENAQNIKKATETLRKNGMLYTQIVLDAYDSRLITNNTLTDYLGTNLQVVNEIRKKLLKETSR